MKENAIFKPSDMTVIVLSTPSFLFHSSLWSISITLFSTVSLKGGKARVQNPVLAGEAQANSQTGGFTYSRPQTRDLDAISQASGAYVGKRAVKRPARQMSAQSKTVKLTPNARTFYPEEYFKRVGYQKSEAGSRARVDALG